MRLKKTYHEMMQDLVAEYRAAGHSWPASSAAIAKWAIKNGKWARHGTALERLCARDIAQALRDEFYTDPQGRRVRTKHAARFKRFLSDGTEEQQTLWDDLRTAPRSFMDVAFKQRRNQIVSDCRQLKTDVDSFNDNGSPGRPIPMLWDFTPDIEESQETTTYTPSPLDPAIASIIGSSASATTTARN